VRQSTRIKQWRGIRVGQRELNQKVHNFVLRVCKKEHYIRERVWINTILNGVRRIDH
jgi:hypothetical protein